MLVILQKESPLAISQLFSYVRIESKFVKSRIDQNSSVLRCRISFYIELLSKNIMQLVSLRTRD
ncbi:hypothetical protein HZS_6325 [Henneguya salminicola]|nr:hypothetical protein HZS_6325 [Henneguya salminicola]